MQCEDEEGEIVDDDSWVGQFCKLNKCPDVPQSRFQETNSDISDDPPDSDDDFPVIRPPERPANPLNKYNVWQIDISEDLCTSLNTSLGEMLCGPNDRDVESYSYIPSLHFDRNMSDSKDKLNDKFKKFNHRGARRRLPPLSVTESNTSEEIADDICKKLHEKNHYLIYNTVEVIGKKRAIHLYRKTRNIEGKGGLQVLDRSRRRTSGGVFAYLIHQDKSITPGQIKDIFHNSKDSSRKQYRKKRKKKNSSKATSESNQEQELKTRGELELEKLVRTPPPSPAVPSSPPQDDSSTAYLLDRTSAALAHTNDMQIE